MTLRWLLASIHLLALGIGLGAVWVRGRALRTTLDPTGIKRVFNSDTVWGIAAVLWIATGVWRVFGGFEKGTAYYLGNPLFHTKMALLLLILALEIRPMMTLIRWRREYGRGQPVNVQPAKTLATISHVQGALIVVMIFVAAAMARGVGF